MLKIIIDQSQEITSVTCDRARHLE